ncbi:MAG: hypothetical protein ACLQGP_37835, partial [Isosphaeraceae bacterium]
MGRLRTVSLILILGAWGGATKGANPDDAAAAPSTATRQAPPAPPIKYLEAGAKLFNTAQFDLASKYLEAANRYRDMLQDDERSMLDAYLKELADVRRANHAGPGEVTQAAAPASPAAPMVSAPSPAVSAASPGAPVASPGPVASAGGIARPGMSPSEAKQRGRWLLHEGREQLLRGNYDLAQAKVDEARTLEVQWGLFDDTPDKLQEDISKVRPSVVAKAPGADDGQPHDRKTAKAKLHQAREMMNDRRFQEAEALALEVKQWGLSYGLFDDTPDKVAAAARALRRRDKIRETKPSERSSQALYDELVQESRHYMKTGRLDEAEEKARKAERMGVVPGLETDRAESVLHEIAIIRAKNQPSAAPLATASDPTLAVGAQAGVAVVKADNPAEPSSPTDAAPQAATPASDPEVQRIAATEPNAGPDLAAPAADGAQALSPAPTPSQSPVEAPGTAAVASASATPSEPTVKDQAPAAATPANRGEQLLVEAKALFTNANYAAALQLILAVDVVGYSRLMGEDEAGTALGVREH